MPTPLVLIAFALLALPLTAQDAATMAAQQANQAAIQANQDAMRQAQQANEDAARPSQQANEDTQRMARGCTPAARPKLSVPGGVGDKPVNLKHSESTRGAVVYYTTHGWTPATACIRFTG